MAVAKTWAVPLAARGLIASSSLLCVVSPIIEALHLFPWMHWGLENSVGHYLDFGTGDNECPPMIRFARY
jgi:hypothetical protein